MSYIENFPIIELYFKKDRDKNHLFLSPSGVVTRMEL